MAWFRRTPLPPALAAALLPDELVLANAKVADGGWLAVTRYGIWQVPGADAIEQQPHRIGWPLISKARWRPPQLELIVADVAGSVGSADLITDRPARMFQLESASKLTDIVHQRVRSGIVSSVHHELPGGGCWVVLRRVPGRDGVSAQVRLDEGTTLSAVETFVELRVRVALGELGRVD